MRRATRGKRAKRRGVVRQAERGDTVKVHYTGKLATGTVFDSSRDGDPLQFTIGEGQVIPGFEQAVIGMNLGECKTAKIPAERAYGPRRQDMVVTIDRHKLPADLKPEVGQRLRIRSRDGRRKVMTVTDVSQSSATLDANPPLAGKDLVFDIQLVAIV